MTSLRGGLLLLLAMLIGIGRLGVGAEEPAGQTPADANRVLVTISKETTFITKPLRKDGYPDYVRAANVNARRGVTVQNNAVVPLARAYGPDIVGESIRKRFYKMLGIDLPPAEGDYQISFEKYTVELVEGLPPDQAKARRESLREAFEEASSRPWSTEELPEIAGWLDRNEAPLKRIVRASWRSRYYAPLIAGDAMGDSGMVIAILLPVLQEMRTSARLLKVRAMRNVAEGNLDAAWEDLLACHRLGRLAGQDLTLVGMLVAIAIDGIAIDGDARLVETGDLTRDQAERMVADLAMLAPLPSAAAKLDTLERMAFLDAVCTLASGRAATEDLLSVDAPWAARAVAAMVIDWDVSLRMGNTWYDRLVEAASTGTFAEQLAAMAAIEEDIQRLARETKSLSTFWSVFAGESIREVTSEKMGGVMVALLLPALSAAHRAEVRSTAMTRLDTLCLTLAAYRADHGAYPRRLEQLVPEYVDALPLDPVNEKPPRYVRKGSGFWIYSLGPNREDNGGHDLRLDRENLDAMAIPAEWDDWCLRVIGDE